MVKEKDSQIDLLNDQKTKLLKDKEALLLEQQESIMIRDDEIDQQKIKFDQLIKKKDNEIYNIKNKVEQYDM